MRARDRSVRYAVDQEGGVGTTAAATPAISKTIRGELTSAEVVDGRGGDAIVRQDIGMTGGWKCKVLCGPRRGSRYRCHSYICQK